MLRRIEKIFNFFFPNRCILCNRVVSEHDAVCADCREDITLLSNRRVCKKCSRPVAEDEVLCRDCLVHPHYFTACFAAAVYKGKLRKAILRFKFYKRADLHRGFARLILSHLSEFELLPRFDAVIGIPLSRERLAERGYNQAVLIARAVARKLDVPLLTECLEKIRHTPAQSTLSYSDRQKNLRGAFRVVQPKEVRDKVILLIDDVYTTGATADEASRLLLRVGAKAVYVAVAAATEIENEEVTYSCN